MDPKAEVEQAICRSYNQWLVDICGKGEGRLKWVAVVPVIDIESAVSEVRFAVLSAPEIDWYVATGEGNDKAGAYAVQGLGAWFVDRIDGNYSNVVGLPLPVVYGLLKRAGIEPLVPVLPSRTARVNPRS